MTESEMKPLGRIPVVKHGRSSPSVTLGGDALDLAGFDTEQRLAQWATDDRIWLTAETGRPAGLPESAEKVDVRPIGVRGRSSPYVTLARPAIERVGIAVGDHVLMSVRKGALTIEPW